MTEQSRSTIKDRPLRAPGQSLQEERERLLEEKLLESLIIAVMLLVMAAIWVPLVNLKR